MTDAELEASTANAWLAEDLQGEAWRRPFTAAEIEALEAALAAARRQDPGLDLARLDVRAFPLAAPARDLVATLRAAVNGRGFQVLEGFPVERFTRHELRAIYWGLAQHLGTPVAQSKRGDLLGDVRDIGTGIAGRTGRGYTSNQALNFHCDAADVTGLFWLSVARAGGVNRFASALAVHDAIAARRPDLLQVLYRPLYWSWQGNQPPGTSPYYAMAVYGRVGDAISCSYVRTNILLAHANAGAPPMTPEEIEAVEYFAAVAKEPAFYVEGHFEPGTMAFMNNHTVLHMRTAFEDWEDPARRRHLLRVWVCPPDARALPATFAEFYGDVARGARRGGYPSQAATPVFETA